MRRRLEAAHRQSIRIAYGLPKHTPTHVLYSEAQINTLEELREDARCAQVLRLAATSSGRRILAQVGRKPQAPLLPTPSAPWLPVMSAIVHPLPTNVGVNEISRRRYHHRRAILNDSTAQCIYTDAAVSQNHVSTAWTNSDGSNTATTTHSTQLSTTGAELQAILEVAQAARYGRLEHRSPLHIYTDSQDAVRELSKIDAHPLATAIHEEATLLRHKGTELHIHWTPSHMGAGGNERADALARGANLPTPHSLCPVSVTARSAEDVDAVDAHLQLRQHRKLALQALLPEGHDPLPPGLPRRERVALRRLRTGTAVTPAFKAQYIDKSLDPTCGTCTTGAPATAHHLLWTCPGLSSLRRICLAGLQSSVVTLNDWILPRGTPQHRKAIYDSLLTYLIRSETINLI